MQKTLLLILAMFCFSPWLKSQDKSLDGKWYLQEIQLEDSIIIPDNGRFHLVVDRNNILFNKEKNSCGMTAVIQDKQISDCRGACTKVCCDDWYGTTSQYFDVNGSYEIKGEWLTIHNKWGKLIYQKAVAQND